MKRIIWHWTAGAYGAIDIEREHYHFLIHEDGRVTPGKRNPEANRSTTDGDYAAHTRACNTGAIGIALDAMAGATHTPFSTGKYPITEPMLDALVALTADLCETYHIPVTRQTVLSHAEVEPTLGIRQSGKWDITWIPGMSRPGDPVTVGDKLRARVQAYGASLSPAPPTGWFQRLLTILRRIFG